MKKISIFILLLFVYSNILAQDSPKVIITEIMYDSPLNEQIAQGIPYSNGEYVEIYNMGATPVSLANWTLRGGGTTEIYTFPANVTIAPNTYKIIAYRHYDTEGFLFEDLYYGLADRDYYENTYYQRKITLSNSGEAVYLIDNNRFVRDSIYYDGNSNKTKPGRLSADNADGTPCMQCMSLQRIMAEFDQNGRAISNNAHWTTAKVTPFAPNEIWKQAETETFANGNYIKIRKYTEENAQAYLEAIQYYNGLGYLEQEIKGTSSSSYLVSLYEYDLADRESKRWLPIATQSQEYIHPYKFKLRASNSTNYNDTAPYVETIYEAGASDRPKTAYQAGQVFRQANAKKNYGYNAYTESDEVRLFYLDRCDTIIKRASYPFYGDGELRKEWVTDEIGKTTVNYIDHLDRTVLTRVYPDELDTYYVYDYIGRVRLVITPEASVQIASQNITTLHPSSDIIRKYCYYYRYDKYGNLFEKQFPGKEKEYYIYRGDLLQLWQDGNLRKSNQWLYTMYDSQKRIYGQEIVSSSETPESIFNGVLIPYWPAPAEVLARVPKNKNYFVWSRMPVVSTINRTRYNDKLWQITDPKLQFQPVENIVSANDVFDFRGAKIYEMLSLVNSPDSVEKAFYYDKRGQLIQTVMKNHLDGITRISTSYDFAGNPEKQQEDIQAGPNAQVDTKYSLYTFTSDNLLQEEQTCVNPVPGDDYRATTFLLYDGLRRLSQKAYGHEQYSGAGVENYTYNLQGWETSRSNDYLDIKLRYYDPINREFTPYYNGNIAKLEWQHRDVDDHTSYDTESYVFEYDEMSQLLAARNSTNNVADNKRTEGFTYSLNGNVRSINRKENGIQQTYSLNYSGNQLATVSGSENYAYDVNGNMTHDGQRNLDVIYNRLNLVEKVSQNGTTKANYSYLSDGTKLSVRDTAGNGYEYLGSLVYKWQDGSLQLESAPFAGGRFVATQTAIGRKMEPYYHLTDHLGDVRVIVDKDGNVKERNDYYAYGKRWENTDYEASDNRYLYNGKEEQVVGNLKWLDYGARMYNPELGRWFAIDPMAESYYSISPYAYCVNNPVGFVDQGGKFPVWFFIFAAYYKATAYGLENYGPNGDLKTAGYVMNHPINGYQIGYYNREWTNITSTAGNYQINLGRTMGWTEPMILDPGGLGNAFRHAFWQAMITNELGEQQAVRIGNAHENKKNVDLSIRTFKNLTDADTTADLLNNIIGRAIGNDNSGASRREIARAVMNEFHNNGLWVAVPQESGYTVEKHRISRKEYNKANDIMKDMLLNGLFGDEEEYDYDYF